MMDLNSISMMDKDKARNIILATVLFLVSLKIEVCLMLIYCIHPS